MEVIVQQTPEEASVTAGRIVAGVVKRNPRAVLGLCTGSTPLLLYRELIRQHREEGLDFSAVTTFNLDEYVGLSAEHPASYHRFIWDSFFAHVNVTEARIHIPDGMADDIPAFCERYEGQIRRAGGIDLQVLGLGGDGHIGFNEPSSSLGSRTRIKTLTDRTRRDNAEPFGGSEEVPKHVITMGVGTILDSRAVLMLAFGYKKAAALARMIEGPVTASVPASALQLHPVVKVVVDEGAASELTRTDYYRAVYEGKPEWQK